MPPVNFVYPWVRFYIALEINVGSLAYRWWIWVAAKFEAHDRHIFISFNIIFIYIFVFRVFCFCVHSVIFIHLHSAISGCVIPFVSMGMVSFMRYAQRSGHVNRFNSVGNSRPRSVMFVAAAAAAAVAVDRSHSVLMTVVPRLRCILRLNVTYAHRRHDIFRDLGCACVWCILFC